MRETGFQRIVDLLEGRLVEAELLEHHRRHQGVEERNLEDLDGRVADGPRPCGRQERPQDVRRQPLARPHDDLDGYGVGVVSGRS